MSTSTTQSTSSSSTSQLGQINKQQLQNSFNSLISNYTSTTPPRIKLIDCFLLFLVVTGILEFAYRVLVTSHPFHAFAGG
jgi:oligosaccharyltransferase complex subunit epsilon